MAELTLLVPALRERLRDAARAVQPEGTALVRELARADVRITAWPGIERAIIGLFAPTPDTVAGVAGLSAAHDFASETGSAGWLRADPVYLHADATRIVMRDASTLHLEPSEAAALVGELNAAFAHEGVTFRCGQAPTRWYVQPAAADAPAIESPRDMHGHTIERQLGALRESGIWQRRLTVAQLVLHQSAVNRARVARGVPPVNSVWWWGGGPPARFTARPHVHAFGVDHLLESCCRAVGAQSPHSIAAVASSLSGELDTGAQLVLADIGPCELADFIHVIWRPALAALVERRLTRIVLRVRGVEWCVTRATRRRWWRRPARVMSVLETTPA